MINYAVLGIFICTGIVLGVVQYRTAPPPVSVYTPTTISIGATTVVVEVATTPALRAQGLSGKESLAWGRGMLFIFPKEEAWGFWMKDMQFPIDIIWADKEGVIHTILSNVLPSTYPQVFHPVAPALYVLEVPAGYARERAIGVGQKIVVQYSERVE